MIGCSYPWILLLAVPAVYCIVRSRNTVSVKVLRSLCVILLFCAAARPVLKTDVPGTDVVILYDRSKSIPSRFLEEQKETIGIFREEQGQHDRVGILSFGRNIKIRKFLTDETIEISLSDSIDRDGTFLSEAVQTGLSMIPPERNGCIAIFSDGLYNGTEPAAVIAEANEREIPVFFRYRGRSRVDPLCITAVEIPGSVEAGSPFQINAFFRASMPGTCRYTLKRGNAVIAEGSSGCTVGSNILRFRDRLLYPGIETYRITLTIPNDPFPENNAASGSVRVKGKKRICLVTPEGRQDNLSRALKSGDIDFDIIAPAAYELTPEFLDGYRAVIIENVPAAEFNQDEIQYLKTYVSDEGGGFMLTGGRNSFGPGGYCRSPVEEILPVSMEVRKEHRKVGMALGLVLDRSGSMSMSAGGGKTKMDLANLAAASSADLLTEIDTIGVVAVDSSAHIIVDFEKGNVNSETTGRILEIESMGGGIFVYTGLKAIGAMMRNIRMATKHIILFADAADAEEPGSYRELIAAFRSAGITVSVVALGTEKDQDADFLRDVAKRGEGNIFFTTDPMKLPALFSMDTVSMVRESFVEERISGTILNDIYALGDISGTFPALDAYNRTYSKKRSTIGILGMSDEPVPLFAFRQFGLGRSAALSFEADGPASAEFLAWNSYGAFFTTVSRWLAGVEPPEAFKTRVEKRGHVARIFLDIDPDAVRGTVDAAPELLVFKGPEDTPLKQAMEWAGPYTLTGEFPMEKEGVYRPAVLVGDTIIKADPVNLPLSPEYEYIKDPSRGEDLLKRMSEKTGGSHLVQLSDIFNQKPRRHRAHRPVVLPFLIAALICFTSEIGERRFFILFSLLTGMKRAGKSAGAYMEKRLKRIRHRTGRESLGQTEKEQVSSPHPSELSPSSLGKKEEQQEQEITEKRIHERKDTEAIDSVFDKAKGEAKKRF